MGNGSDVQGRLDRLVALTSELEVYRAHKDKVKDGLGEIKDAQDERWARLKEVTLRAAGQVAGMRHDALEAQVGRDEGAPIWLPVVAGLFVSLFPLNVIAGSFIYALSGRLSRTLRISKQPDTKSFAEKSAKLRIHHRSRPDSDAINRMIKAVDQDVSKLADIYKDELGNLFQNWAQMFSEWAGKRVIGPKRPTATKRSSEVDRTDTPANVISQVIDRWIVGARKAENLLYKKHLEDATNAFDTLSANARSAMADKGNLSKKRSSDVATEIDNAKSTLVSLAKQCTPTENDLESPPDLDDLKDLQKFIETMVFCTTYSFKPIFIYKLSIVDARTRPVDLPGDLWDRLIARYGKMIESLPRFFLATRRDPKVGMSRYFEHLFSLLTSEQKTVEDMLRRHSHFPPPGAVRPSR